MSSEVFKKICDARERLRGQAHVTPVVSSRTLNQMVGAEVFFKCENLQRIGAFKFRGAYNAISQLTPEQKKRGVVTFSSGNHAQAVALSCKMFGIHASVVMPRTAPASKRAATAGYGAEVVLYDGDTKTREKLASDLQSKHGYTMVPPFDDLNVIAGQGTATAELIEEVKSLDYLLAPCGGGGLLSGTAVAAKHLAPDCKVIGIEPIGADDANRSFYSKTLQRVEKPQTIADGVRTPSLGNHTFKLILENVDAMHTVSEEAIKEAVRFLFYRMKLVVEPSGALGLAAILSNAVKVQGRVGIILSGGNVDGDVMRDILAA
ncbi:MAG: Pyridoxal-5-phosphate-dependent protein beta subunit [Verrucomicrobiales bacterium]|nr:Pyridoxal-5-phosphate-dependent protein beta subunit [Verrucomicrobiales bacterium]